MASLGLWISDTVYEQSDIVKEEVRGEKADDDDRCETLLTHRRDSMLTELLPS